MQSRLSELRQLRNQESNNDVKIEIEMEEKEETDDTSAFMKDFENVKKNLNTIRANTERIDDLRTEADVEVKDDRQKEIMTELNTLIQNTKKVSAQTKAMLDTLDKENEKYAIENQHSATTQIRNNFLATHTRHFHTAVRDFQEAAEAFRKSQRDRVSRQARIVLDRELKEEEIDKIIESEDPGQFMREAMGIAAATAEAVAELEERAERMQEIEQGVKEIQELFMDMAALVEVQQEYMDNIEQNIVSTLAYTEKAEEQTAKAEESQKGARKWQCRIFMCLLVILVIIIVIGVSLS